MNRPKRITIRRTRSEGGAECEQCGTVKPWTRERARRHADASRHTVRYVIEDTTTYSPAEDTRD